MASWELDFWGRVRSLKDAALQNYLASDAAARAATLSLITQVADGYPTLRELDERLALTRATIASRAESLRIFKRRFEVGAISRLDLTQVETLWQQATALGATGTEPRGAGPRAGAAGGRPAGAASGRRGWTTPPSCATCRRTVRPWPAAPTSSRPSTVKSRQRQHRRRPRAPSVHHADRRLRHRQRRAGRPVRQRQPRLELRAEAEPADLRRRPPLRRAGPGRDALRPGRGRLRESHPERFPRRVRRAVGAPLAGRAGGGVARHRRRAGRARPAGPAALRPRRLALPGGAGRERDLLAAQQKLVQTRRALLSSRVGYAALGGGTRPPATPETPTAPPMPPRPRRFATNKPEGSPPMRIPAKKLLPALLVGRGRRRLPGLAPAGRPRPRRRLCQRQRPHRSHRDRCRRQTARPRAGRAGQGRRLCRAGRRWRACRSIPCWPSAPRRVAQQQRAINVASAAAQTAQRESDKLAAQAVVAQRESELDAARRRLARSETLSREGASSIQELDDDRARVRSVQAAVHAARAQVTAAAAAIEAARAAQVGAQSAVEAARPRSRASTPTWPTASARAGACSIAWRNRAKCWARAAVLNIVDLADVYMTFFLPEQAAAAWRSARTCASSWTPRRSTSFQPPCPSSPAPPSSRQDGGNRQRAAEADVPREGPDQSRAAASTCNRSRPACPAA